MSLNISTAYFSSAGDGVTTTFGFAAPVQAAADIVVQLVDTLTGAATAQTLGVHYTVMIASDSLSASVVMIVAPPVGKSLVRRRNADYLQPYKLPANGPFPNDMVEAAIDRVVEQLQAIRDIGNRGVRLADSDAPTLPALPPLASILGKYLFINLAGVPIGTDGPAGVAVSGAMTPVVQAVSLAVGRAALDVPAIADLLKVMIPTPQGRLTLSTGVPVMTAAQLAKTTLFYTPHGGNRLPLWDGSDFAITAFTELSNITTNAAVGNAGPAAVVGNANYDVYAWRSGGTNYLTRSDWWKKPIAATMTIAAPCVVTMAGHGMTAASENQPVVFSTTGALPTGVVAGTVYYAKWIDANTFNLAATPGGASINTSGAQSGVHTGNIGDPGGASARGAGGNCQLQSIKGLPVNVNAITNGPASGFGTYLGTVHSDASGQLNWQPGGVGANGTAAQLCVWNAYNRVAVCGLVGDSTDSWTYTTATVRAANASNTMRVSFVVGLQEDWFEAAYQSSSTNTNVSGGNINGIGYDATNAFSGVTGYFTNSSAAGASAVTAIGSDCEQPLGFHFMQACEYGNATGTTTWYGDNGGVLIRTGLTYRGRF